MTDRDYKKEPHPIWARFLEGKLDLQTAFWGYLVGGTIVWCFACMMLPLLPFEVYSEGYIYTMALGVFVISNRVWVSANNYIKEKHKKDQPVVWGILTQCVCALNALSMIAILYDVIFN